jgi:hypothetical protein
LECELYTDISTNTSNTSNTSNTTTTTTTPNLALPAARARKIRIGQRVRYIRRLICSHVGKRIAVVIKRFLNQFFRIKMGASEEPQGTRPLIQSKSLGGKRRG